MGISISQIEPNPKNSNQIWSKRLKIKGSNLNLVNKMYITSKNNTIKLFVNFKYDSGQKILYLNIPKVMNTGEHTLIFETNKGKD